MAEIAEIGKGLVLLFKVDCVRLGRFQCLFYVVDHSSSVVDVCI